MREPLLLIDPKAKGSYVLVVRLATDRQVKIGKLGSFAFPAGYHLYFGTAVNGLAGRVKRHLRRDKSPHWHIDYLLAEAEVVQVWAAQDGYRRECQWTGLAAAQAETAVPADGFGSSDCRRCRSHLVLAGNWATVETIRGVFTQESAIEVVYRLVCDDRFPKNDGPGF